MASVLTKEEILKALNLTPAGQSAPKPPPSADWFSRAMDLMNNPVIQATITRLIDKFLPSAQKGTSSPPSGQVNINISGKDIFEYFFGFLQTQDENLTIGQFKTVLRENKEKFIQMVDNVIKSGILRR